MDETPEDADGPFWPEDATKRLEQYVGIVNALSGMLAPQVDADTWKKGKLPATVRRAAQATLLDVLADIQRIAKGSP